MKLKLQNLIVLAIFMAIGLGLKAQVATVGAMVYKLYCYTSPDWGISQCQ